MGIGALAIPGLGPFIAAGPIMAALAGAGVGGAVGGLTGALIGMGIPEYEAKRYEGRVKDGGILLSVHLIALMRPSERRKSLSTRVRKISLRPAKRPVTRRLVLGLRNTGGAATQYVAAAFRRRVFTRTKREPIAEKREEI